MANLDDIYRLTRANRELIDAAGKGTCLYCKCTAKATRIDYLEDGTALCPVCGVDALLPVLSADLVRRLHLRLFGRLRQVP